MQKGIIITIGRQFCSGGSEVGNRLAEKLCIPYYDRELMEQAAKEKGFTSEYVEELEEKPVGSFMYSFAVHSYSNGASQVMLPPGAQIFQVQTRLIEEAASRGSCVIVGRSADFVLREDPRLLSVFIYGSLEYRAKRCMELYGIGEGEAVKRLTRTDRQRASYYNSNTTGKWGARENYDLCLDVSRIGIDAAVEAISCCADAIAIV